MLVTATDTKGKMLIHPAQVHIVITSSSKMIAAKVTWLFAHFQSFDFISSRFLAILTMRLIAPV